MNGAVSPPHRRAPPEPCVWMSAHVLEYRLCDRDFQCQTCPLHAALAGASLAPAPNKPRGTENHRVSFPADRLYTAGHTWVSTPDPGSGRARIGLDAFAAALIGRPRRLRRALGSTSVERGEPVCEFDLEEGALPIGAPIDGRVRAWNRGLTDTIDAVTTDPYGEGWLAEVETAQDPPIQGLFGGAEALRRSRLDAGRFCRGAALRLLASPKNWEDLPPTCVCGVADLHRALRPDEFISLLLDLVH